MNVEIENRADEESRKMAKQIKPERVIEKMAEIINEQRQKGYKAGWCSYQIKEWQFDNAAGLIWLSGQLSYEILRVCRQEVESVDLLEDWNDDFEMYAEMEAAYS